MDGRWECFIDGEHVIFEGDSSRVVQEIMPPWKRPDVSESWRLGEIGDLGVEWLDNDDLVDLSRPGVHFVTGRTPSWHAQQIAEAWDAVDEAREFLAQAVQEVLDAFAGEDLQHPNTARAMADALAAHAESKHLAAEMLRTSTHFFGDRVASAVRDCRVGCVKDGWAAFLGLGPDFWGTIEALARRDGASLHETLTGLAETASTESAEN